MKSEGVVNDAEYMIKQGKDLSGLCKTYISDYVGKTSLPNCLIHGVKEYIPFVHKLSLFLQGCKYS